jgi:hypothetical protein
MTLEMAVITNGCHCEEQSDEAISTEASRYGALPFVTCKRNLDERNGMLRWLGLGLLLGTGLGSAAWAQGSAKFDGQYMGELTLTKVINDCTQPPQGALYPLTISRGEVRFAYVPRFDTTLSGKVDENGTFKASARLRRGYVQMTGHIQGNNLTAHIVSPSCNYTFQTKN